MIIALIATTTILTFLTWTLIKSPVWRTIWGILSLLAFVGSVYILTDHFINHIGLTVKSEVTRQPIYTAGETSHLAPNQTIKYWFTALIKKLKKPAHTLSQI